MTSEEEMTARISLAEPTLEQMIEACEIGATAPERSKILHATAMYLRTLAEQQSAGPGQAPHDTGALYRPDPPAPDELVREIDDHIKRYADGEAAWVLVYDARKLLQRARDRIVTEKERYARDVIHAGERIVVLEAALRDAVEVIKNWHNMPGADGLDSAEDVWPIYYANAPEMALIRRALEPRSRHE
jgi:hypothetical protein